MKRISTLDVLAVASCHNMHDHGTIDVRFTFNQDNPLVVCMRTGRQFNVDLSRETLDVAVRDGHLNDCGVVGFADVTYKVPRSATEVLSISWLAPRDRWLEGDPNGDRFYVIVRRFELNQWLRGTYAQVPRYAEFDALNLDGVIKQIMESAK